MSVGMTRLSAAAAASAALLLAVAALHPAAAANPGDPASERRAPPMFDILKDSRGGANLTRTPRVDVPLPEHVPPPDRPPAGAGEWPPTQRQLQRLDEPPLGRAPPVGIDSCPAGRADCR